MSDKVNNMLVLVEIALLVFGVFYMMSAIDTVENDSCRSYWDNYVPGVEIAENPMFSGQKSSFTLDRDPDVEPLPESSSTGLRLNGS